MTGNVGPTLLLLVALKDIFAFLSLREEEGVAVKNTQKDMNLTYQYRAWHDRRVSATKDAIYFSRINEKEGEEQVIDAIPLFEIEEIGPGQGENQSGADDVCPSQKRSEVDKKGHSTARQSNMVADSTKVKFRNSFQIRTQVDGYNSGRSYYLKAASAEECTEVMDKLKALAKTAKKLKDAKTRFQESQERIRVVYHSTAVQGIVAAMIVAVLNPPQRHGPGCRFLLLLLP